MKNSNNKKKEIVVVVHDAGGAEVIGAYLRTRLGKDIVHAYGAGPARNVFKRLGLPLRLIADDVTAIEAVMTKHHNASYALLAAPGWMTQIEIRALRAAKKAGIKAIVYMDSWTDERKRFGYPAKGWQQHDPDEFWVGDKYELERIHQQYSHVPVRLVPSRYFVDEVQRFKTLKRSASKPAAILFVSNPSGTSRELLAELLRSLAKHQHHVHLRVRFHPGDHRERYDTLIAEYKGTVHVEKSHERDLVKDLLHARVVVGTETMALVIAALCKIPTINFVPRGARSILPFPQIMQAGSTRAAVAAALSHI